MMYIIVVGFIGLIVGISTMIIITKLTDEPEAGLIGGLIVIAITLIVINIPSYKPEVKKANKLKEKATSLADEAYDTKILHGGIPVELYNKIEEHNEKVKEEIDENNFWIKANCFNVDSCIVDISDYKIITENAFTQPVRITEDPTEPTSEPVAEVSTETVTTAAKQVVEIDGQYYELVPVS